MNLKVKHICLIIIMILQPIVWWFIYLLLYKVAKVNLNGQTDGLAVTCCFCGAFAIIVIFAYLISDIEDKPKK